ncbi:M43 family zinc metalloprotease, partial [Arthrobacter sp. Br18]|uniref:M43 family zinc metalloprotease n=1 Tax=Arthrobacter sp. Br18 TaxID=1312954 RepID=UPI0020A6A724
MNQPGFNPILGEQLTPPSDSAGNRLNAPDGGAAAFGPRTGTFTVTLVTVVLSGSPNSRISDFQLGQAKASIIASNDYWRAASNGRLGMQFGSEYRDVVITANSTDQYYDLMAKITAKMQWTATPNDALVVYVPVSQFAGGVLGGGFTDGSNSGRVIMPVPSGFTNNVVTHEFGHVLGLNHANSLQCSNGSADIESPNNTWGDTACDSRGYGDTMDLMGLAQYTLPPINAYLWEYGGFGRGDEILDAGVIDGSRSFTLQPWSGTAARRAVKFVDPVSRETYYLSFRSQAGSGDGGATGNNRGVMIHKKDARGDWPDAASLALTPSSYPFSGYYNQNHAWQQGSTFRTARGTTVRIDSVGPTSANVTISGQLSREAVAKPFIDGAAASTPTLGAPVSEVVCGLKDNGCYRGYANGAVLWSAGSGAAATLNGTLRTAWLNSGAQNGPMGYPLRAQGCGIKDNGCY